MGLLGVFKNSKFTFETVTGNDGNGLDARFGDLVRHALLIELVEGRVTYRRYGQ